MKYRFEITGLDEVVKYQTDAMKSAAQAGVQTVTDSIKDKLRAHTQAAGFSRKMAFTWRGETYPKHTDSFRAAGTVWSKAPAIIEAFDTGATIHPRDRKFLAVPLPPAREIMPGGRRATPADWPEGRLGELRLVPRKGKPALLVVDGMRAKRSGKSGGFTKATVRKETKTRGAHVRLEGLTTVPMFVLVKRVKMEKKLNIDAIARAEAARLPRIILGNLE